MSCGPATKNGSVIRSRASLQIFVGEGSVAPGREQRICQTVRISTSITSGGSTRAAKALSRGPSLLAKLAFGGESRSTAAPDAGIAGGVGSATVVSDLSRGMVIQASPSQRRGEPPKGGPWRITLQRV